MYIKISKSEEIKFPQNIYDENDNIINEREFIAQNIACYDDELICRTLATSTQLISYDIQYEEVTVIPEHFKQIIFPTNPDKEYYSIEEIDTLLPQ